MKTVRALTLAACVAGALADGHTMTVTIGSKSYTPDTDITPSLATSEAACAMKGSLGEGDYAATEALYVGTVLEDVAKEDDKNEYTQTYSAFYGGVDWLNTQIMAGIKGTGDFASMDQSTVNAARNEYIEKTGVDGIAFKQVMKYLWLTMDSTDATSIAHWDHAFASFFGKDMKCAIYARAQKRAGNFGTYATGDAEIAAANEAALNAFIDGAAALKSGDYETLQKEQEAVIAAMVSVYTQASLRYLYLLDMDVTESTETADHQGEALAFWQVVSPMYKDVTAQAATFNKIQDTWYNLKVAPVAPNTRYCEGKDFFAAAGSALEFPITTTMVGTFEYDDKWSCPDGTPIKDDAAPTAATSDDDSKASDDSSARTTFVSVFGAIGAFFAYML